MKRRWGARIAESANHYSIGGSNEAARLQPHRTRRRPEPSLGEADLGAMVRRAVAADARAAKKVQYRHQAVAPNIQSGERTAKVCPWSKIYDLLDVELPLGSKSRCDRIGQSVFNHDRGPPG